MSYEIGRMLGAAALFDVDGRGHGDLAEGLAKPHADHVAWDSLAHPDAGIASLRDYIDQAFFMIKLELDPMEVEPTSDACDSRHLIAIAAITGWIP